MRMKPLPSLDRLQARMVCNTREGKLFWKPRPESDFNAVDRSPEWCARAWNSRYAGEEAFTAVNNRGYYFGSIDGCQYLAHRVVWKMHTGDEPSQLDHINGDRSDNRIKNLRVATSKENAQNRTALGASGYKGVHQKSKSHWIVIIGNDRISGFRSDIDAALAYDCEAYKRYGDFARLNFPERLTA